MYAFICITNIILANWPEFLRNCRSQSLHSWVKKLQWDGSNLSHFHGEGCDWANHPKSTKSLDDLDVRYQHGSSPKIFQVSTHHFFQLQRLFALKVIFKPWQPCCFRTEKRYIHFHLAWQHRHDFEFQIRKAKPEKCATPSGRSMENRLRYEEICSAYLLLGQLSCTASGSENLAQAQVVTHTTCRTQEGISRSLEKKRPEFSNVASKF